VFKSVIFFTHKKKTTTTTTTKPLGRLFFSWFFDFPFLMISFFYFLEVTFTFIDHSFYFSFLVLLGQFGGFLNLGGNQAS